MKASPEPLINPYETPERFIAGNHMSASLTDRSGLSFPDLSRAETGADVGTTLRFIFWAHAEGNEQSAIPLIEGCNILVLEAATKERPKNIIESQTQDRERRLRADIVSLLVSGQVDPMDPASIRRLKRHGYNPESIARASGPEGNKLIRRLVIRPQSEVLVHYVGQLDKVFLADLEPGDVERFADIEDEASQKHKTFHQALEDGESSWAQIGELAIDHLQAKGRQNQSRENVTVTQLEHIVRKNPGSKIAVLYGNGHQPLTRMIETPGVRLQRQFAEIKEIPGETIHLRLAELHMGLESSLRGRAFDQNYLDQYLVLVIASGFDDEDMRESLAKMSATQLSVVAERLSELWKEPIDYYGDYDDLGDAGRMIKDRREQTEQLLIRAGKARRMGGLLRFRIR